LQGNKEATNWLEGKDGKKINAQLANLHSESGKTLAAEALQRNPSAWWSDVWTPKNREN
jgi:hypothetical protein